MSRNKDDDYARVNDQIRSRKIRLISNEGSQIGIVNINRAKKRAREEGFDLVEVAPNADPPVCKIMDYGKYKYKQQKREQAARKKQKKTQLKEVRFSSKIEDHDYKHKLKRIKKFLDKGHKVRVHVYFRGREITHKELGRDIMDRISEDIQENGKVEKQPHMEGKRMLMLLSP